MLAQGATRPVPSTLPHGALEAEGPVQQPVHQGVSFESLWQHSSSAWIVAACVVLLLVAIVFLAVVGWYRRRLLSDEGTSSAEPWTLDDLRRLRADGSLTEDEYQRMRAAMIAAYQQRGMGRNRGDPNAEKGD